MKKRRNAAKKSHSSKKKSKIVKRAKIGVKPNYNLSKLFADLPALKATGRDSISVRAGVTFAGKHFDKETKVLTPVAGLDAGFDYFVTLGDQGRPVAMKALTVPDVSKNLGGFHFAPGGNAKAREGGDTTPAINPFSIWDKKFLPANKDPRGQFLTVTHGKLEWLDIYKLCKDHLIHGTSKFGVTIADGNDAPQNPAGGYFSKLDYDTAAAVMKHHGKTLASVETLFYAAFGVKEKTAASRDPNITGLDAPRTSQRGMMQATGNLWDWCHDGDPENPRPSLFGGSWFSGGDAGSRDAYVAYIWPGNSVSLCGARGRSDHLQLA